LLPFISLPPTFHAKNNLSSLNHKDFVKGAILDLLVNRFIIESPVRPYCSNPLTVADNGKLRLVLDLRHINKFLKKTDFTYENLKTLSELFDKDDFFIRFDLRSGYHHININPHHYQFLGFEWDFDTGTRFFMFTVLPFGLSTACYVFTKVMRPLNTHWRSSGIKSIIYLDDGIGAKSGSQSTKSAGENMLSDLHRSGFIVNIEKSDFEPTQVGEWLGFVVNTRQMKFFLPDKKIQKIKKRINHLLTVQKCTPKDISRVTGTIASTKFAIGQLVHLFTRHLNHLISTSTSWYQHVTISEDAVSELKFWLDNIEHFNGHTFKPNITTSEIIFSDASDSGYGGFSFHRLEKLVCAGKFTAQESSRSSTYRELLAVKLVLQSYDTILRGQSIQINVDNYSASRIMIVGSRYPHLQQLAIDIFRHCLQNDIKLIPRWIPRNQNTEADALSRLVDTDDWGIDDETFNYINSRFGPFTIDRFADDFNRKLQRFNSKYFVPGSSRVNAFTADWGSENNWICPPLSLVGSVLRHMKLCKAHGTLLIPAWPSSWYWPLIYPDGFTTPSFVKEILTVNPCYHSPCPKSMFHGYQTFPTIALRIAF
jgi:hypothetical protein